MRVLENQFLMESSKIYKVIPMEFIRKYINYKFR